ncbi:MAG: hypothetical protein IM631_12600 [Cytophagales bacterium]|nr:hypothetical protein [Cytophagales bacterium]MCA6382355.1 hypothetical protein [Cytophagales bacterium]
MENKLDSSIDIVGLLQPGAKGLDSFVHPEGNYFSQKNMGHMVSANMAMFAVLKMCEQRDNNNPLGAYSICDSSLKVLRSEHQPIVEGALRQLNADKLPSVDVALLAFETTRNTLRGPVTNNTVNVARDTERRDRFLGAVSNLVKSNYKGMVSNMDQARVSYQEQKNDKARNHQLGVASMVAVNEIKAERWRELKRATLMSLNSILTKTQQAALKVSNVLSGVVKTQKAQISIVDNSISENERKAKALGFDDKTLASVKSGTLKYQPGTAIEKKEPAMVRQPALDQMRAMGR